MKLFNRARATHERTPYKLLSILLQYPDRRLQDAEEEIRQAVAALPPSRQQEAIARFYAYWTNASPTERAQRYVETFDLQKRCGLHLSFYLQGDRRQRGTSLLRLKRLYAAAGLVLEGGELPDYLPAMLEFAAFAPAGYGETVLGEYRRAIEIVRTGLRDLDSPYVHLLDALCEGLPHLTPLELDQVARLIVEGPPSEQVGLGPYDAAGAFAPPEIMPRTGAGR